MTTAELAHALHAKPSGKGWYACCPAHDDKHPSLYISDSNGKTLVFCHAGCSNDAVIEALKGEGLWASAHDESVPVKSIPLWQRNLRAELVEDKLWWLRMLESDAVKRGNEAEAILWRREIRTVNVDDVMNVLLRRK
ncbi:MAG: hypothetical protein NVS1B11_36960 [Terriglobales bacterium]